MTAIEINPPTVGHPYSVETPRYLGSVRQRPYHMRLYDKRSGTSTEHTHNPSGVFDYWAYRDGVYTQWRSTVDNEVGALRAYSAWSLWHETSAARTLYGAEVRERTRQAAPDKIPGNW